jgi:hypothetical protein
MSKIKVQEIYNKIKGYETKIKKLQEFYNHINGFGPSHSLKDKILTYIQSLIDEQRTKFTELCAKEVSN